MRSALGQLHVLDFSRVLAGPFATMQLADLGATVTKVERPEIGDETRTWGPPFDSYGESTYFQSVNRNKTSLVLDLTSESDRRRAQKLAQAADVLVENFRPGLMDDLGLGYEQLRVSNPTLIYCSITGFGRGAGASWPGYDLLIQALGGLMSITGSPDGDPQKVGVALVDVVAGLFAAVGILAALEHRHSSGEGQLVEVNLLSSLLAALVNQGSAFTSGRVVPGRLGNDHPSIAPYGLFASAGGELVLAVGNDRQFADLCHVIGAETPAEDPRFSTNSARVEHSNDLRLMLEEHLAQRAAADWATQLVECRVPAGVVNDIAGAFALAEKLGLEPTVDIAQPGRESVELTRSPIVLSKTPPAYRSAPPRLGRATGDPSDDSLSPTESRGETVS